MKYGKRSIWKGFLSSPLAVVVLIIVLVLLARAVWGIHAKSDISALRLAQSEAKLSKLNERKSDLEARVSYLSTDEGVESEIRTKFRGVKTGESVAVILDSNSSATPVNASTTGDKSWLQSLFDKLGL